MHAGALQGGAAGFNRNQVPAGGAAEMQDQRIELLVAGGRSIRDLILWVIDHGNALQGGGHLGEQPFDDSFLDLRAFGTTQVGQAAGLHLGQFLHFTFGPQQGGRDLAFGLHQVKVDVARHDGGIFGDVCVHQMPARDPAVDAAVTQRMHGGRCRRSKLLHAILRKAARNIEHSAGNGSTLKRHGKLPSSF